MAAARHGSGLQGGVPNREAALEEAARQALLLLVKKQGLAGSFFQSCFPYLADTPANNP